MKRASLLLVLCSTLLAAAGCGSKAPSTANPTPAVTRTVTASGSATPSTSPSPQMLVEFTVDGAGPYQIGQTLTALKASPGLDEVASGAPACPDNTVARGTGTWKDIRLSFHKDGKLYLLVNRSESIPTPSGVYLGTPVAQIKTIYAGVSTALLTRGTSSAFLVVTLGGGGILFDLDSTGKVTAMTAGDANFLRMSFQGGTSYC